MEVCTKGTDDYCIDFLSHSRNQLKIGNGESGASEGDKGEQANPQQMLKSAQICYYSSDSLLMLVLVASMEMRIISLIEQQQARHHFLVLFLASSNTPVFSPLPKIKTIS
ncbi:hypothetical protein AMR41_23150 [Hapalosiphon sp. MRB220]|nr:hypothetical protein AMR41_23150 [Hapalosiphon sp. MRB220]